MRKIVQDAIKKAGASKPAPTPRAEMAHQLRTKFNVHDDDHVIVPVQEEDMTEETQPTPTPGVRVDGRKNNGGKTSTTFQKGDERAAEAGRKSSRKGVPNGMTRAEVEAADRMAENDVDPLLFLCSVLKPIQEKVELGVPITQDELDEGRELALRLLPFQHSRQATITKTSNETSLSVDGIREGTTLAAISEILEDGEE